MVLWHELFVNKALNNLVVQETIFIFAHDFYGKTDFKNTLYANSYTHNIIYGTQTTYNDDTPCMATVMLLHLGTGRCDEWCVIP